MTPRRSTCALMLAALAGGGCGGDFDDDPSRVVGLRLLGVVADPPEVAPGAPTTLRATAAEPGLLDGGAPSIAWWACPLGPLPGSGATNPACLAPGPDADAGSAALIPLGAGPSIAAALPPFAVATLGPTDETGGVYLPIRLRLALGDQALDAVYRLRVTDAAAMPANAPNQNPVLAAIEAGALVLDPAARVVLAGHQVHLAARFAAGSAEAYRTGDCPTGDPCRTESLSVSWFSTAGTFDPTSSGDGVATTLTVPGLAAGATRDVDVWAVARDGRGGSAVARRQLTLRGD